MQMQRCELEMSTKARGICSNDDVYDESMTLWSYDDGEVSFHVKAKPDKQCQTLKRKIEEGGQDVHVASKRSKPNHIQSRLDDCSTLAKDHGYTESVGASHSNIMHHAELNADSCQTEAVIPSSSTKTLNIGETGATKCLAEPEGETVTNCLSEPEGETGANCLAEPEGETGANCLAEPEGETGANCPSEPEGETGEKCISEPEGETGASQPTEKSHLGETSSICLIEMTKSQETRDNHLLSNIGESGVSHQVKLDIRKTGASRFSGSNEDKGEARCLSNSNYLIRTDTRETGANIFENLNIEVTNTGRPMTLDVGETKANCLSRSNTWVSGADCFSGRPHVVATDAFCPPRSAIGEVVASYPNMSDETDTGVNRRILPAEQHEVSCIHIQPHLGAIGAWGNQRKSATEDKRKSQFNELSNGRKTVADEYKRPKIPVFDGTETWPVWINRFEAIAELRCWDEDSKLDFLLPNLQGKVGEYAFGVLPRRILNSYTELVDEISSVFTKVEIPRTYAAKFHKRVHREDESIEEYAEALRCLYFKGYEHRDRQTREEDLVQRFLDGLRDPDMRFTVEYHRKPTTLDEAVYHAVEYVELRSRIFEGAFTDKRFNEQRTEECGEYNTDESAVDCCFQDDSQLDCISVDERSGDQTWKEAPSIAQGHEAEVLNAIIQIKDSLQTLVFHNNLDNFRDDSMKMQQTETIECNSFKSEYDVNQRQDNLTSSKLSNDIDQSEPVNYFHSQQEDQGCIGNATQCVPDAECGILDRQSIGDQKTGERPENSYYTEVVMRDLQPVHDKMDETLEQGLREHFREMGDRMPMDNQLLLPRNKFLPCKGETPPKCLSGGLGQLSAAVSVAA